MDIQVFGAGCTSNEPITIIVTKPRFISQLEHDLIDARDKAHKRWQFHASVVDDWTAKKDYDALEELVDECVALDHKASMIYKQLNCNHDMRPIGGQRFVGGGIVDDTNEGCVLCGVTGRALLKRFHTSSVRESIVEIP